jgi:DNA-binding NtrC family response regulator
MSSERVDSAGLGGIDFPRAISVLVIEDDFGDYDAVARAMKKMVNFEARTTRAKTLEAARKLMAETAYDIFLIDCCRKSVAATAVACRSC